MSSATQAITVLAALLLVAAAALALLRIARGPSALDRVIATDVLVAVVIAAVAVREVSTRTTTGLPIVLVLSLLGFTGAVALARLITNVEGQRRRYRQRWRDTGDGAS